jgi:hypothetical protein
MLTPVRKDEWAEVDSRAINLIGSVDRAGDEHVYS